MQDLALLLQQRQRLHGLLKRHLDIRPVDQIQVDMVSLKVLKGFLALPQDIVPAAVADIRAVDKIVAAFRGDDHLVPDAHLLNGLPHKALRHAVIVGRRRVDEIHAAFHGGPDSVQPGILGIVIPAGAAHPPCTEGHFGNLQARASKCFITHSASSRVQRDF